MQATSDKTASANFTQTAGPTYNWTVTGNITGDTYGRTGYNPFFQWGRKDAFRSSENDLNPADGTSLIHKSESVTVGTTIKTPTTHYYGSNNSPYASSLYLNAWNATYTQYAGTSTDKIDGLEKVVKTVYDPCPVGYTVPPANTFISFTIDNMSVDGKNRKYTSNGKTLYIPYSGQRSYYDGILLHVGERGFYCLAVTGTQIAGRVFRCSSDANDVKGAWSDDSNGNSYRSAAQNIRPVSENVRQH